VKEASTGDVGLTSWDAMSMRCDDVHGVEAIQVIQIWLTGH
jgi:hypothetical protein